MTKRATAGSLALLLIASAVLTVPSRAKAGDCTHCPKTTFCRPKPPCIKYKCVCPKPVACPCDLEHFGYYSTCWHPWLFPPDYSHCVVPPTAVMVPPAGLPSVVPSPIQEPLPTPRTMAPKVTLDVAEVP